MSPIIYRIVILLVNLQWCLIPVSGDTLAILTDNPVPTNSDTLVIDQVWAGHPVGFVIKSFNRNVYIGYYDAHRRMTIAEVSPQTGVVKKTTLPSVTGWDSHNYIDMAMDKSGYIHISGNMHVDSLVYFRSKNPFDITEFERLEMTGKHEDRVTYPRFFQDNQGTLCFQYRNGRSGEGATYWNRYDVTSGRWSQAFESALFDGEGEASAYPKGLTKGPDGYFYIVWMWRLTNIANTNHNISCIRSKDLSHWENLNGVPQKLPIQWRNSEVIVVPIGPWNGLINANMTINWDSKGRFFIAYHLYDESGISQIFATRYEGGLFRNYQISNWKDFRWAIDKGGSLSSEIGPVSFKSENDGLLRGVYSHKLLGKGVWYVRERDMQLIREESESDKKNSRTGITDEEMIQHRVFDQSKTCLIEWKTKPVNQDRKPELATPLLSPLKLIIHTNRLEKDRKAN